MECKRKINRLRYENFPNARPGLLKYKPRCCPHGYPGSAAGHIVSSPHHEAFLMSFSYNS
jgi:hypothetical protein